MRDLPTGTVTFLFTDIEGSTSLLQRLADRYADALSDHHRLIRAAITSFGGVEVSTHGDAFFVVFASAHDAVAAALSAQRSLQSHAWPTGSAVRVRMGVHTGEGHVSDGTYVGLDVHQAARIAAVAHGAQILLSDSTGTLVRGALPEGVTLRLLGQYRLKGLERPIGIFQLAADDLLGEFPPLHFRKSTLTTCHAI